MSNIQKVIFYVYCLKYIVSGKLFFIACFVSVLLVVDFKSFASNKGRPRSFYLISYFGQASLPQHLDGARSFVDENILTSQSPQLKTDHLSNLASFTCKTAVTEEFTHGRQHGGIA